MLPEGDVEQYSGDISAALVAAVPDAFHGLETSKLQPQEISIGRHVMTTILSGRQPVKGALLSDQPVERFYFSQTAKGKEFSEIKKLAQDKRIRFDFVPVQKISHLTRSHDHQGVAAVMAEIVYADLPALLEEKEDAARILAVVLDRVQRPKNLGAIIRSAAGTGADVVIIPKRGSAHVNDQVIRGSAGATFRIPIAKVDNLARVLRQLKDLSFWVYGLDARAHESVFDVTWPARCALVVGNELSGIRPLIRKECDTLVRIPLANNLDSLNVSAAAAIALFQVPAPR